MHNVAASALCMKGNYDDVVLGSEFRDSLSCTVIEHKIELRVTAYATRDTQSIDYCRSEIASSPEWPIPAADNVRILASAPLQSHGMIVGEAHDIKSAASGAVRVARRRTKQVKHAFAGVFRPAPPSRRTLLRDCRNVTTMSGSA
jgi:hypothetical protein